MKRLVRTLIALLSMTTLAAAAEPWSQTDLLNYMIDVDRLAQDPVRVQPVKSVVATVRSGADEWEDVGKFAGPGILTRIWCEQPAGRLRITLDDQPTLELPAAGIARGNLDPFPPPLTARHGALLYPLGFNERCTVQASGDLGTVRCWSTSAPARRTFAPFTQDPDPGTLVIRDEVRRALRGAWPASERSGARRLMPVMVGGALLPGRMIRETVAGAGTVRAFYVGLLEQPPPEERYALHQCVVRIYFDGEDTPRVAAPLSDFFGAGPRWAYVHALPVGSSRTLSVPMPNRPHGGQFMYCDYPMPYHDGLRVEIDRVGGGDMPVELLLYMLVDLEPPAKEALRFHARYLRKYPCGADDLALAASGPGRLVGVQFAVACPQRGWWRDAEVQVTSDDAKVPVLAAPYGEFFEFADEPELRDAALSSIPQAGPFGRHTASRWLVAEAVPFEERISVGLELDQATVANDPEVTTVVYWYAAPGTEVGYRKLTMADLTPVGLRIPEAIEIEDHIDGDVGWRRVKEEYAAGAELSRGAGAYVTSKRPLRMTIPSDTDRTARLDVRVHPARAFEPFTVHDDDGRAIGTVSAERRPDEGVYPVGPIELRTGVNSIEVRCSSPVLFDCWLLAPVAGPGVGGA